RRAAALELVRRRGVDLEAVRRAEEPPRLLDVTFAGWRRRGRLRPIGPATYSIQVESDDASPEEPPRLRVTIVPEDLRKPFGPDDLEARRLPASEWRLVEPLARSPSGARDFTASGESACTFLERFVEAALPLTASGSNSATQVTTAEVRPALVLRPALAADLFAHPLLSEESTRRDERGREFHDAWVAYNAIVAPIEESDFRRLLGLSAEVDTTDVS